MVPLPTAQAGLGALPPAGTRRHTAPVVATPSRGVREGGAYQNDTPVFAEAMRFLVFRPYWEVPPSIMLGEIRPKAMGDSTYLARNHYDQVRGNTVVTFTPETVDAIGRAVRVRQQPGPLNNLGGVKFMMPNNLNIYRHDTSARNLFDLLAGTSTTAASGWPIRLCSQSWWSAPTQVNLSRKIPVLVLYGTAIARENGQVFFYQDIYGHGRSLPRMLAAGYPYPRK